MKSAGKQRPSLTDYDASRYQFIMIELDLAITFCQISLTTGDIERANRNVEYADQAHGSAIHFLKDARMTPKQSRDVDAKLKRLRPMLKQVGLLRAPQKPVPMFPHPRRADH